MLKLKRAYDEPSSDDGFRVLIDRLWPRGISKEDLELDLWLKDVAPSTELRKWFGHDPDKWDEFRERYFGELDSNQDILRPIIEKSEHEIVTLVYSAKNEQFNDAVALKEYLEGRLPG